MKALILGAGYGNRLSKGLADLSPELREVYGPRIEGVPKPLVPVAGKPLINYLLDKIERETSIHEVYVVSNSLFFPKFEQWRRTYRSTLDIFLIDNGNCTYGQGNGVIHDIHCAVEKAGLEDDLLLIAGDTLFEMNFGDLISHFYEMKENVIATYMETQENMSRRGCVVRNTDGLVTDFIEKPEGVPPSLLAAPISYVLTRAALTTLKTAIKPPYDTERNFVEWGVTTGMNRFFTFDFPKRYDIGKIEDLIAVDREFSGREIRL